MLLRGVLTGDSLLEEEKRKIIEGLKNTGRTRFSRFRKKISKGDVMLCIITDSEKGKDIVTLLKDKIKENYHKKAGKFSPPLEFRDLGKLGEYGDPLTFTQRERHGICIVSNVGANEEWFESIAKDAVKELEESGVAALGGVTFYRPVFEVFGR